MLRSHLPLPLTLLATFPQFIHVYISLVDARTLTNIAPGPAEWVGVRYASDFRLNGIEPTSGDGADVQALMQVPWNHVDAVVGFHCGAVDFIPKDKSVKNIRLLRR